MPNVMVALPNIGGALCSTTQSLADAHYYMPCSNAAKTRNPLKLAGMPQTTGNYRIDLSRYRPKFTILWGHLKEILLLNKSFFRLSIRACKDISLAWQSCAMVPRWRFFGDFLRPVFSASSMQHVSDMHLKFALCASVADIQSATAEIRRGKKKRRKKKN